MSHISDFNLWSRILDPCEFRNDRDLFDTLTCINVAMQLNTTMVFACVNGPSEVIKQQYLSNCSVSTSLLGHKSIGSRVNKKF